MHKPQFVTFTGFDNHTFIPGMIELSQRYPVEWGVLVTAHNTGKPRYPWPCRIDALRYAAEESGLQLSLHLCNGFASDVNTLGALSVSGRGFSRIQVNALWYDMVNVTKMSVRAGLDVIVQHRDGQFPPLPDGIHALHDPSGGKGRLAKSRPPQRYPEKLVGYAGGINPDNVQQVMSEIDATNYWLDMETGVRTNDWFDLDKCAAVCRAIWG